MNTSLLLDTINAHLNYSVEVLVDSYGTFKKDYGPGGNFAIDSGKLKQNLVNLANYYKELKQLDKTNNDRMKIEQLISEKLKDTYQILQIPHLPGRMKELYKSYEQELNLAKQEHTTELKQEVDQLLEFGDSKAKQFITRLCQELKIAGSQGHILKEYEDNKEWYEEIKRLHEKNEQIKNSLTRIINYTTSSNESLDEKLAKPKEKLLESLLEEVAKQRIAEKAVAQISQQTQEMLFKFELDEKKQTLSTNLEILNKLIQKINSISSYGEIKKLNDKLLSTYGVELHKLKELNINKDLKENLSIVKNNLDKTKKSLEDHILEKNNQIVQYEKKQQNKKEQVLNKISTDLNGINSILNKFDNTSLKSFFSECTKLNNLAAEKRLKTLYEEFRQINFQLESLMHTASQFNTDLPEPSWPTSKLTSGATQKQIGTELIHLRDTVLGNCNNMQKFLGKQNIKNSNEIKQNEIKPDDKEELSKKYQTVMKAKEALKQIKKVYLQYLREVNEFVEMKQKNELTSKEFCYKINLGFKLLSNQISEFSTDLPELNGLKLEITENHEVKSNTLDQMRQDLSSLLKPIKKSLGEIEQSLTNQCNELEQKMGPHDKQQSEDDQLVVYIPERFGR